MNAALTNTPAIDEDELVCLLEECDRLHDLQDLDGVKSISASLKARMAKHNIKETPAINLVLKACREAKAEINRKLHGG